MKRQCWKNIKAHVTPATRARIEAEARSLSDQFHLSQGGRTPAPDEQRARPDADWWLRPGPVPLNYHASRKFMTVFAAAFFIVFATIVSCDLLLVP